MGKYSEEFLKKMIQAGTLGYPLSKIINIFDIENVVDFTTDFYDLESEVHAAYQKGVDKADFILDSKLFEMAKNGDLKALDKFEARKRSQLFKSEQEKESRH